MLAKGIPSVPEGNMLIIYPLKQVEAVCKDNDGAWSRAGYQSQRTGNKPGDR